MSLLQQSGVLHSGPATFFGREHVARPEAPARVAIVGVPWDEGNGGRNGANYGPRAVRDSSDWFSGYDLRSGREVWDVLGTVDGGDVPCFPADAPATMAEIADHVADLAGRGILPFLVGGNHAITIGAATGAARACDGPMGYLSIDTHLDTAADWNGSSLSSGCPTYRAAELDNVDPANVVVYGVHGWLNPASQVEAAAELGIRWYGRDEIRERGLAPTFEEAVARASEGVAGLYVTFDMDCMDSSCAPGCGTPEPGGFLADEAIEIARRIGRAAPSGLDIVEIAPVYDPAGVTPRLACRLMMEMLGGLAETEAGGG
jgi:agmatinase